MESQTLQFYILTRGHDGGRKQDEQEGGWPKRRLLQRNGHQVGKPPMDWSCKARLNFHQGPKAFLQDSKFARKKRLIWEMGSFGLNSQKILKKTCFGQQLLVKLKSPGGGAKRSIQKLFLNGASGTGEGFPPTLGIINDFSSLLQVEPLAYYRRWPKWKKGQGFMLILFQG